ncbi:MAG: hypothetical protein ABIG11_02495, partial [bacterium]
MNSRDNREMEESRKALSSHKRKETAKIFLVHILLLLFCVVCAYPLLRIFSVSLRPGDRLISTDLALIPAGAGFASYATLLKSTGFLRWLWNSLVITC